eukprot:6373297-Karenia_brevis.AAC.1
MPRQNMKNTSNGKNGTNGKRDEGQANKMQTTHGGKQAMRAEAAHGSQKRKERGMKKQVESEAGVVKEDQARAEEKGAKTRSIQAGAAHGSPEMKKRSKKVKGKNGTKAAEKRQVRAKVGVGKARMKNMTESQRNTIEVQRAQK